MKKRMYILGLLLSLSTSAVSPLSGQARIPLTNKIARAIRRVEPGWRYNYGWCTCPPSVPGQVWRDIGHWERKDKQGHAEAVNVWIIKAASSEESAEWMRRYAGGGANGSCQIESYQLGDEGYLFKCPTTYKSILNYRKGRFLVQVRGDSQEIVERFGRYVVMRLPAS
jgi:hypothetical protein